MSTAVDQQIAEIKTHMPEVYKGIQAKAVELGTPAYALVRRGLRGEPNCFFAFERGRVVGTPFNVTNIMAVVAQNMVQFGVKCVLVWPDATPPIGTPTATSRAGNSTPAGAPVAGLGESPVSSPRVGG